MKAFIFRYKSPDNDLWFIIKDKHFTSPERAGQVVYGVTTESHPEVHFTQSPPGGDYALASQVGINYNNTLTTDEFENRIDISISPNPTGNNRINIQLLSAVKIDAIIIYNILGKMVFSKQVKSIEKEILVQHNLTKGTYVIKVNTEEKELISKKIIIE